MKAVNVKKEELVKKLSDVEKKVEKAIKSFNGFIPYLEFLRKTEKRNKGIRELAESVLGFLEMVKKNLEG